MGKYRTRRVSLTHIYFAKGSSHLSQSLIFVQASHLCESHLCASFTSVQVSSWCKSHICASFTSVQVSHRCKSHICASFTSVQVLHRCKFHICASLTSGQVSHLSKNLIFVQVLLHAHACTFLEHSCVLGYLGPNKDRTRKPVTYFSHSLPGVI